MKKPPLIIKAVAALLCVILLTTNCVLAYGTETNFWSDRQKSLKQSTANTTDSQLARLPTILPQVLQNGFPSSILSLTPLPGGGLSPLLRSLSPLYGSVRKVSVPQHSKNGKTIIHIQDVHRNQEAQINIGKTIQVLITHQQVDLIALEGAFAPIDLTAFRNFTDQPTIHKVADYLLKENKISGPIHAAFISPQAIPPIVGVDDQEHYQSNVEAYKRSAPLIKPAQEELARLEKGLAQKKSETFNVSLAAFDGRVQAHRQGTISLGEYIQTLSKAVPQFSPTVKIFVEALNLETSFNFSQVEAERSRLLSQLLSKLTPVETQSLTNQSLAYRQGNIRNADFYQYVEELCDQKGLSLSPYPSMRSYFRYVELSEKIDAEVMFKELSQMEEAAYAALVRTPAETRLLAESKRLHLVGKLLNFALTPEEWGEYKAIVHGPWTIDHGPNLSSFERFYEEAEARDQAITENLLREMNSHKAKVAVLVTGGFHSAGISKLTHEAGINTISFVPKITQITTENGSSYLSVFTQEKSPLEKLFEGEKLFLAENPAAGQGLARILSVAEITRKGGDARRAFEYFYRLVPVKFSATWDNLKARVSISFSSTQGNVTASIGFGSSGLIKPLKEQPFSLQTTQSWAVARWAKWMYGLIQALFDWIEREFILLPPMLATEMGNITKPLLMSKYGSTPSDHSEKQEAINSFQGFIPRLEKLRELLEKAFNLSNGDDFGQDLMSTTNEIIALSKGMSFDLNGIQAQIKGLRHCLNNLFASLVYLRIFLLVGHHNQYKSILSLRSDIRLAFLLDYVKKNVDYLKDLESAQALERKIAEAMDLFFKSEPRQKDDAIAEGPLQEILDKEQRNYLKFRHESFWSVGQPSTDGHFSYVPQLRSLSGGMVFSIEETIEGHSVVVIDPKKISSIQEGVEAYWKAIHLDQLVKSFFDPNIYYKEKAEFKSGVAEVKKFMLAPLAGNKGAGQMLSGENVLDLGSGAGDGAVAMAQEGAHVTAVDIRIKRVEAAIEKLKKWDMNEDIEFKVLDILNPGPFSSPFDKIFSRSSITFIFPALRPKMLLRLRNLLKPGGKLLFFEPLDQGHPPLIVWKEQEWREALSAAGYEDIQTDRVKTRRATFIRVIASSPLQSTPQSWTGTWGGKWMYGGAMPFIEEGFRFLAIHYGGVTGALVYSFIHALLHYFTDVRSSRGSPERIKILRRYFWKSRLWNRLAYSLLFPLPYIFIPLFPVDSLWTAQVIAGSLSFLMHSVNNLFLPQIKTGARRLIPKFIHKFFSNAIRWRFLKMSLKNRDSESPPKEIDLKMKPEFSSQLMLNLLLDVLKLDPVNWQGSILWDSWEIKLTDQISSEQLRLLLNFEGLTHARNHSKIKKIGFMSNEGRPLVFFTFIEDTLYCHVLNPPLGDKAENRRYASILGNILKDKLSFPGVVKSNFLIERVNKTGSRITFFQFEGVHPVDASDSDVFFRGVRVRPGEQVLEMGVGGGRNAILASLDGALVTAVDISCRAVLSTMFNAFIFKAPLEVGTSDLFKNIPTGKKFNRIYFNIPNDQPDDDDPNHLYSDPGMKILEEFLEKAGDRLEDDGVLEITYFERPLFFYMLEKYGFDIVLIEGTNFNREIMKKNHPGRTFDYSRFTIVKSSRVMSSVRIQQFENVLNAVSTARGLRSYLEESISTLQRFKNSGGPFNFSDELMLKYFMDHHTYLLNQSVNTIIPEVRINPAYKDHDAVKLYFEKNKSSVDHVQSWTGTWGGKPMYGVVMPLLEESLRFLSFYYGGGLGILSYSFLHALLHYFTDVRSARGSPESLTELRRNFFRVLLWNRFAYSLFFTLPYLFVPISPVDSLFTAQAMHAFNNLYLPELKRFAAQYQHTGIYRFFAKTLGWSFLVMSALPTDEKNASSSNGAGSDLETYLGVHGNLLISASAAPQQVRMMFDSSLVDEHISLAMLNMASWKDTNGWFRPQHARARFRGLNKKINVHGHDYNFLKLKYVGTDGPPQAQAFTLDMQEKTKTIQPKIDLKVSPTGIVSQHPSLESPVGGGYLEDIPNEIRIHRIAVGNGIPTSYPVMAGEYEGLSFKGKKMGFLGLLTIKDEPIRIMEQLYIDIQNKRREARQNLLSSVVLAAKTLGMVHRAGLVHKQPHLRLFKIAGNVAWIFDWAQGAYIDDQDMNNVQFSFWVMRDFLTLYGEVDQFVLGAKQFGSNFHALYYQFAKAYFGESLNEGKLNQLLRSLQSDYHYMASVVEGNGGRPFTSSTYEAIRLLNEYGNQLYTELRSMAQPLPPAAEEGFDGLRKVLEINGFGEKVHQLKENDLNALRNYERTSLPSIVALLGQALGVVPRVNEIVEFIVLNRMAKAYEFPFLNNGLADVIYSETNEIRLERSEKLRSEIWAYIEDEKNEPSSKPGLRNLIEYQYLEPFTSAQVSIINSVIEELVSIFNSINPKTMLSITPGVFNINLKKNIVPASFEHVIGRLLEMNLMDVVERAILRILNSGDFHLSFNGEHMIFLSRIDYWGNEKRMENFAGALAHEVTHSFMKKVSSPLTNIDHKKSTSSEDWVASALEVLTTEEYAVRFKSSPEDLFQKFSKGPLITNWLYDLGQNIIQELPPEKWIDYMRYPEVSYEERFYLEGYVLGGMARGIGRIIDPSEPFHAARELLARFAMEARTPDLSEFVRIASKTLGTTKSKAKESIDVDSFFGGSDLDDIFPNSFLHHTLRFLAILMIGEKNLHRWKKLNKAINFVGLAWVPIETTLLFVGMNYYGTSILGSSLFLVGFFLSDYLLSEYNAHRIRGETVAGKPFNLKRFWNKKNAVLTTLIFAVYFSTQLHPFGTFFPFTLFVYVFHFTLDGVRLFPRFIPDFSRKLTRPNIMSRRNKIRLMFGAVIAIFFYQLIQQSVLGTPFSLTPLIFTLSVGFSLGMVGIVEPGDENGSRDHDPRLFLLEEAGIPMNEWGNLLGKTNWKKVNPPTLKILLEELFQISKKTNGLNSMLKLQKPHYQKLVIPMLGKKLGGLYNYFDGTNETGITTVFLILAQAGIVQMPEPVDSMLTIDALLARYEGGEFRSNGKISVPWGKLNISLIREFVEELAATKGNLTTQEFKQLSDLEKKMFVLAITSDDLMNIIIPSIQQKLGGLLSFYVSKKGMKTARWLLLEEIGYLPLDLIPLDKLARSQDLKRLYEEKALLPTSTPWEEIEKENASFILRLIKELAAVVVYGAGNEEAVASLVETIKIEDITRMKEEEFNENIVPGLGRNLGHLLKYLSRHSAASQSVAMKIKSMWDSSSSVDTSLILGQAKLEEAIKIHLLRGAFWEVLPNRTKRVLLHGLSTEAHKQIRELVRGDYAETVVPFFEGTLGGMYSYFSGLVPLAVNTTDFILQKVGFILDEENRHMALRAIKDGLNTSSSKEFPDVVNTMTTFIKSSQSREPHLTPLPNVDDILFQISKSILEENIEPRQLADRRTWLASVDAYSAFLDTKAWIPELYSAPYKHQLVAANRIFSLEQWAAQLRGFSQADGFFSYLTQSLLRLALIKVRERAGKETLRDLVKSDFSKTKLNERRSFLDLYISLYRTEKRERIIVDEFIQRAGFVTNIESYRENYEKINRALERISSEKSLVLGEHLQEFISSHRPKYIARTDLGPLNINEQLRDLRIKIDEYQSIPSPTLTQRDTLAWSKVLAEAAESLSSFVDTQKTHPRLIKILKKQFISSLNEPEKSSSLNDLSVTVDDIRETFRTLRDRKKLEEAFLAMAKKNNKEFPESLEGIFSLPGQSGLKRNVAQFMVNNRTWGEQYLRLLETPHALAYRAANGAAIQFIGNIESEDPGNPEIENRIAEIRSRKALQPGAIGYLGLSLFYNWISGVLPHHLAKNLFWPARLLAAVVGIYGVVKFEGPLVINSLINGIGFDFMLMVTVGLAIHGLLLWGLYLTSPKQNRGPPMVRSMAGYSFFLLIYAVTSFLGISEWGLYSHLAYDVLVVLSFNTFRIKNWSWGRLKATLFSPKNKVKFMFGTLITIFIYQLVHQSVLVTPFSLTPFILTLSISFVLGMAENIGFDDEDDEGDEQGEPQYDLFNDLEFRLRKFDVALAAFINPLEVSSTDNEYFPDRYVFNKESLLLFLGSRLDEIESLGTFQKLGLRSILTDVNLQVGSVLSVQKLIFKIISKGKKGAETHFKETMPLVEVDPITEHMAPLDMNMGLAGIEGKIDVLFRLKGPGDSKGLLLANIFLRRYSKIIKSVTVLTEGQTSLVSSDLDKSLTKLKIPLSHKMAKKGLFEGHKVNLNFLRLSMGKSKNYDLKNLLLVFFDETEIVDDPEYDDNLKSVQFLNLWGGPFEGVISPIHLQIQNQLNAKKHTETQS